MKNHLLLHSNCAIIKGYSRSTIVDLQFGTLHLVPNALAQLFSDRRTIALEEVTAQLQPEQLHILEEYASFIVEQQLGMLVCEEEINLFPPLSNEWLFPAHIGHCIIDSDEICAFVDEDFLEQLAELCCNFVQFRFYRPVPMSFLKSLLDRILISQLKAIELVLADASEYNEDILLSLMQQNGKIQSIILHSSKESRIIKEADNRGFGLFIATSEQINNSSHCGIIDPMYFSKTTLHYTESLAHNTCLNRKISIDVDGNIKNCPSMKESFGNIKDTTLAEAIAKPGFKKYWNITKDEISICKGCEFRHICTDCRAYLEDPEDHYSKPLKCGYNPYTCEWEEWSNHPMKQYAMEYYNLKEH